MIVDAYAHCGKVKHAPLEKVLATMKEVGIERTVLCQHLGEYDNDYLANAVSQYPEKFSAVCLVDPALPDSLDRVKNYQHAKLFRGVRVLAEWVDTAPRLWCAAMDLGMNLLVYAPNGIKSSVQNILETARQCPSAKIVISHLGNPKVADGKLVEGMDLMALAQAPNVYVQLSGQSMFCDYPYQALESFTFDAVKRFGPGRVMWGSNFPVSGDSQVVARDLDLVKAGRWELGRNDIERVVGGTALDVWFASK
ncbi:MAG TPA: amidohydrolase family protein [Terriglobales bacterium]|nr:amidohydrolase family protein [Terriglobales bacterium]